MYRPSFSVQVDDLFPLYPVVSVRGEVDLATAAALAVGLATALGNGPIEDLVVDLRATTFMDCSGVSLLLAVKPRLPDQARLIIRGARPFLRRVIELLDLGPLFSLEPQLA